MRGARTIPLLLLGILLLDLLLNAPAYSADSPVVSLLRPSLDLLLLLAALLVIGRAGERARFWLRIALLVPGLLLIVFTAIGWPGPVARFLELRLPIAVLLLAAAGVLCFLCFGFVLRGFAHPVPRNVFLLAVAFLAILQITTGPEVFRQSAIPRIVAEIMRLGKTV
jgi:hypothetical protein